MLCLVLFTLFTHNCVTIHSSNKVLKLADDATVVGLIINNDETLDREEIQDLFPVVCTEQPGAQHQHVQEDSAPTYYDSRGGGGVHGQTSNSWA